ncbi:MAG: class I SAM-dependent methyltransferase [Actinomycetota bacterium]|nr:class I SAM-dependent methyltransferase [Actinomycetota bacterium]
MGRLAAGARRTAKLVRLLPPRVAWFYFRARRSAAREGDPWSLESATKPESLSLLLKLARGRHAVVEIGTGTAWTTAALALDDRRRRVVSYDPCVRPERDRYLGLAGPDAASRVELIESGGEAGPPPEGPAPDFVFVDGSHERELTIRTFEAWRDALAPGGVIAFHDYGNELYPGVTEAIGELGLEGRVERDVFVWTSYR